MSTFVSMLEGAQRGEVIFIDGGYCEFHLRKDKVLTIYGIISMRPGAGTELLERVKAYACEKGAVALVARCPEDYASNAWWKKKGFRQVDRLLPVRDDGTKVINVYRLDLKEE